MLVVVSTTRAAVPLILPIVFRHSRNMLVFTRLAAAFACIATVVVSAVDIITSTFAAVVAASTFAATFAIILSTHSKSRVMISQQ